MELNKVLIVEDEPILAKDLSRLLRQWGYTIVGAATSACQALEIVSETNVDLVLMDIALKGDEDGIDCAVRIKKIQNPAIVYLTAHPGDELFARAKPTEPQGYLGKPISPLELQRTVEVALFRHNMEKRLRESEERLDLALKAADMGMWDLNLKTWKIILSDIAHDMVGHSQEEFNADPKLWRSLIHPDDLSRTLEDFLSHLRGNSKSYRVQFRLQDRTGQWIWVSVRGRVFERDSKGRALRMVGTILNISERKRAERLLTNADEGRNFQSNNAIGRHV